ncbi:MAG TPA: hypothetical protein EYN07_06120 [Flavobacteriaceae bacterium]|jgi:hypothetical protein|nr:hypothetical protein [Flavobacteriaceae bacterium]MAY52670.1 hypothetical protein [Flavobacteriaceae bacterium]HBR52904.1 hypothetical protein [Flavobacteriaceae bacterium]HIB47741.1 hypothetical protein [Flavobacteriaceae bacterium]HIN98800.1 hypothetical protein [Flavobacteriaceae bacterium]|tara:strand:- start:1109 stop:1801 length:693 start_codon:yes stop_codon:yes gene_type:complete
MKIICTAISFLFISLTFAQNGVDTPETDDYLTGKAITLPKKVLEIAGSPYAEREFQLGNVYKNGKLVANNVALRYNVSRDEIEVKGGINTSNSQARVLKRSPEIYVRVLNDVYVYVKPTTEGAPSGYFNVMLEGEKFHLYKKMKKEFIEGKKAINSVARDVKPTYQDREDLYLVNANTNVLTELSGSRNRKLKAFPSHNKELKKYTKQENININKDYSLKELVAYYNTLK